MSSGTGTCPCWPSLGASLHPGGVDRRLLQSSSAQRDAIASIGVGQVMHNYQNRTPKWFRIVALACPCILCSPIDSDLGFFLTAIHVVTFLVSLGSYSHHERLLEVHTKYIGKPATFMSDLRWTHVGLRISPNFRTRVIFGDQDRRGTAHPKFVVLHESKIPVQARWNHDWWSSPIQNKFLLHHIRDFPKCKTAKRSVHTLLWRPKVWASMLAR